MEDGKTGSRVGKRALPKGPGTQRIQITLPTSYFAKMTMRGAGIGPSAFVRKLMDQAEAARLPVMSEAK